MPTRGTSRIVGLITARGGSKGIPRKNLVLCGGVPLIAHTCRAATGAHALADVYISTDDPEIAAASEAEGIQVPFLRPADLASDGASSINVVQHFVAWLDTTGTNPDAVMLLQPTSPLRTSAHIDDAAERFAASECDSLVSLMSVDHRFLPDATMRILDGRAVPSAGGAVTIRQRQTYEKSYARNGPAILITRVSVIRSGSLYGDSVCPFVMSKLASIDIDDIEDLQLADALLRCPPSTNPRVG